jgi:flagellar biosynthesis/type III secretory pathway M-ring protein FliF/YscJ
VSRNDIAGLLWFGGMVIICIWVFVPPLVVDRLRRRKAKRENHLEQRKAADLPAHVRCGCDICAAWRKARYG